MGSAPAYLRDRSRAAAPFKKRSAAACEAPPAKRQRTPARRHACARTTAVTA